MFLGLVFEERIKLNEANNTKFNFLNKHDPYHAYYEHKIKEIKEGVAQEQAASQQLGYIVREHALKAFAKHFLFHCSPLRRLLHPPLSWCLIWSCLETHLQSMSSSWSPPLSLQQSCKPFSKCCKCVVKVVGLCVLLVVVVLVVVWGVPLCVCLFIFRDIVKLTAQFVARNGANFLDKLMMREQVSLRGQGMKKVGIEEGGGCGIALPIM